MVWITTTDNPFDPATNWDAWWAYDERMGYHTCEYVARATQTSDDDFYGYSEDDIEDVIDEIIRIHNLDGVEMYKKVYI